MKPPKNTFQTFLMELQVEDIPVRFLKRGREHLQKSVEEIFKAEKIEVKGVQVWMTPQRIAVLISGVPAFTKAEEVLVTGPKEDTLKDGLGRWTQRVAAFAKGKGVACEELRLENGRVVFTQTVEPKNVLEILKVELPKAVFAIPFAKTMRWESSGRRFARPIRGITAYWDAKLLRDWRWVPGVVPNAFSLVGKKESKITSAEDYEKKLASLGVYLNLDKKLEALKKELSKRASGLEIASADGEALLFELCQLVERPRVVIGEFDPKFLELPSEVVLAILSKVKLLGLKRGGKVQSSFVSVVENPQSEKDLKTIASGYARVASAKLFDAKFFWDQDLKKPFASYADKLKGIVFTKEMGTLWDKVERVRKIAFALAPQVNEKASNTAMEAAKLYKADLATTLVGEYPELSGKVGYQYALANKVEEPVSRAIFESAALNPEASDAGVILGLAERLDTLLAQFSIGNKPTATEDPLGLKRIADTVLEVFWNKKCECSVHHALNKSWEAFPEGAVDPRKELLEYFRSRFITKAKDKGFTGDRIEAVLAGSRFKDLYVNYIADCLEAFRHLEQTKPETVASMAQSFKRISNILKQADKTDGPVIGTAALVDPSLLSHNAEKQLWDKAGKSLETFEDAAINSKFEKAFEVAAGFTGPLEVFFKEVMVMAEDVKVRQNRLALLRQIHRMVLQIMDPAKLVLAEAKPSEAKPLPVA